MSRYVALLRAINVGGKNIIRMADLKASFEAMGFTAVVTYIQSGNIVFGLPKRGGPYTLKKLQSKIEAGLKREFGYTGRAEIRSVVQMKAVVKSAPPGFGTKPHLYRYDVLFLMAPLTPAIALKSIATNPEVDTVTPGPGCIYFRRIIAKATQSRLNRVVGSPIYSQLTIRNWNTTTTLAELLLPALV